MLSKPMQDVNGLSSQCSTAGRCDGTTCQVTAIAMQYSTAPSQLRCGSEAPPRGADVSQEGQGGGCAQHELEAASARHRSGLLLDLEAGISCCVRIKRSAGRWRSGCSMLGVVRKRIVFELAVRRVRLEVSLAVSARALHSRDDAHAAMMSHAACNGCRAGPANGFRLP